ncbi:hypothetical protein O3G_MSEX006267 [Manduca sexta]|uniref:CCHC-type domain-containing protein n=1 Tax=Manduca sexta TaxID=7130 RepID=A0A921Z3W5_MANSE|nr:hypothetical protein O3G_MSEX006267 [Manduca sexta]
MASNTFERFDLESSQEWKPYIARFRQYMISQKCDQTLYTAHLITAVSNRVYKLMCTLCHPNKPENTEFEALVEIVANHFGPKGSVVAARYEFRKREQRLDENITGFIHQLQLLAQRCEFDDKLEENLRDQLAAGVASDAIRQSLFMEKNLNFTRAKEIALNMEAAANTCKIGKENTIDNKAKINTSSTKSARRSSSRCWRCGRIHDEEPDDCPYLQFKCNICTEKGHLAKMCPQSASKLTPYNTRKREGYVKKRYHTRFSNYFGSDSDSGSEQSEVQVIVRKKNKKRQLRYVKK